MKSLAFAVVVATTVFALSAAADSTEQRVVAARNAAKAYQGALQNELQAAMKAGGPTNAIQVCNSRAPAIGADISATEKMQIGRTSLRLRNAANAPDAWEQQVLELFELRKKGGENPANLEFYEITNGDGKKVFRYMKAIAIPEGAPCLACHGEKIDPAVAAKLKQLYPNDKATGFRAGDIRGAFTITQPM